MLNTLLPILLFAALGLAVLGALRRAAMWRRGRASKVDLLGGLLAMPKRYMVDLHHVVARDKYIANTHVATALGFVLSALLAILVHGFGLHNRVLGYALLLASVLMFVGATFVYLRRRNPPSRLSKGPWMRLPKSLMAFSLSFFLVTLPVAGILPADFGGWLLAALLSVGVLWGVSEMFFGMTWGGPMKHAFAGALHLAWHRRAERFGGGRSTGLKPLDLNDKNAPLGVEKPKDFTWNQLLGFDACVQCGKCEAACPAFAAGQPLNPKKLIQDLVLGLSNDEKSGGTDASFAGNPFPGRPIGEHSGSLHTPIVPTLIEAETLWSCTTCRACVQECPMLIEHVDAIVGLRRNLTLTQGVLPGKASQTLENLRQTATIGGYDRNARYHWAVDLDVKTIQANMPVDVLLVAGEGAFDMRYQRTLRALVKLLKAANINFAVMGALERDTGDTARRLGDEATFQMLAKKNIETFSNLSFKRIVTADPHVMHSLKNEYPAFGGHYEVLHHTTLLAQLTSSGQLKLGKSSETRKLTYHDPCYLGRYNSETEAPRALLKSIGLQVNEMERSGLRGRCCGGGGGAPLTDIAGKQRIPDIRIQDARTIGAELLAVACPQCTSMLEGVVGNRPDVLDIAELLASAMVASATELAS